MPQKKKQPKNKNWAQLSQHFVKQWPDVLEGIELSKMPVDYLDSIQLHLKNNRKRNNRTNRNNRPNRNNRNPNEIFEYSEEDNLPMNNSEDYEVVNSSEGESTDAVLENDDEENNDDHKRVRRGLRGATGPVLGGI